MIRVAVLCCLAAACASPRPAPVTPVEAARTESPAPSTPATTTVEPPASAPPAPATVPASSGTAIAHCLYVDPDHRIVRCYWTREDCEQQMAFNKGLVAGNQTCEAASEAHCFDENGKNQLCYPTAGDCDAMVAKMKKRNRPVSQCAAKRGP